jgi:hypothetical protein
MGKGFGIAALVIVLISYPIPLIGPYIAFLGLLLAAGAALGGDKPLTVASVLLAAVKLYLITPSWMLSMKLSGGAAFITFVLLVLPVGLMIFRQMSAPRATTD